MRIETRLGREPIVGEDCVVSQRRAEGRVE
jgi:hypothetical protein